MKFLVVVPTVRQNRTGFEEVMEAIRSSFTHPTEFHILDGHPSKPATLNRAYDDLLLRSDCGVYVTMDDDYIPGECWQDVLAAGFEDLPHIGALGIWSEDTWFLDYIGAHLCGPEEIAGKTRFHRIGRDHHIAGCMIAFRKEIAVAIGKLPESDLNYQIWEDAYRGRRVRVVGKELAYVVGAPPRVITYEDPPEYVAQKQNDIVRGRPLTARFLGKGGIRDSWLLSLRRWVAQIRGRGKE